MSSASIRAIDRESVHRICSGQVVLDMATAVKELLENSLDAGATSIVVKFKQSGLEYITVTDNGCGISAPNLETLALKHYTSKLSSFNDLAQVRSFGFRGEALSSLCALATLSVTTSTGETPVGVLVDYTSDGTIHSKTPAPMTKGTIVKISNLFEGMPVRRNEFVKNIKREYTKCIGLIQAYALIVPNVRISCVSQTDKKPAVTYIATSGNASVRQNIINVFGPKAMVDVVDFNLELVKGQAKGNSDKNDTGMDSDTADQDADGDDEDEDKQDKGISLTGYISSPNFGKGRSTADRQYFYINGRPCVLPKITRVINEVYHSFNTNQSPFLVANLILPTSSYDVNVSPDKRTIFLHNERMLVEEIRNRLTELFEPSRSTFTVSEARQQIKKPDLFSRLKYSGTESLENGNDEQEGDEEEKEEREVSLDNRPTRLTSVRNPLVQTITLSSRSTTTVLGEAQRLAQTSLRDTMHPIESPVRKRKAVESHSESESESDQEQIPSTRPTETRNHAKRPVGSDTVASAERSDVNVVEIIGAQSPTTSSRTELNVLEGYDPLDDRLREDREDAVSDSDDEGQKAFDSVRQQQQKLKNQQKVIVLDSEVPQEGERDWIMVGFDINEQRRKRALRIKAVTGSRRLQQEKAARRQERRQQWEQKNELAENSSETESEEMESAESPGRRSDRLKDRHDRRVRNMKLSDASFANLDDAKAQKSLSRVISKGDFAKMKVLGQFNRAFIVARLDKYSSFVSSSLTSTDDPQEKPQRSRRVSSDIFVIDQHASDEKYNFETLQAKTVFSTQRMFQPKKLYLTAQEEITVVNHMKMLNQNGFYLDYDPEAQVSHRLQLVTLPVSERVVFDLRDFEELVFLLSQQTSAPDDQGSDDPEENGHGHKHARVAGATEKMVRCSKVRALFASRACRRSVMIGHVLNHTQMKRIVRHMGEIDQPWNCPHGRPTMRHLLDLTELEAQDRRQRQERLGGDDVDMEGFESDEEGGTELSNVFTPVAVKRPTSHQGSLFKQLLSVPSKAQSGVISL